MATSNRAFRVSTIKSQKGKLSKPLPRSGFLSYIKNQMFRYLIKIKKQDLLVLFLAALFMSVSTGCSRRENTVFTTKTVYRSDDLIITQVSPDVYVHTTYLNTQSFGRVPCNGMIVHNENETIVLDTPVDNETASVLISWIQNDLNSSINAVVPTHFHEDCLGGLQEFHTNHIPSYAYSGTVETARAKGFVVPVNSFKDSLNLKVGKEYVSLAFFGEGHTRDNITGYYAPDRILFGGCLIKELNAGKGNLADANEQAWAGTVKKIDKKYPEIRKVIPGHGEPGDAQLLRYTISLFSE